MEDLLDLKGSQEQWQNLGTGHRLKYGTEEAGLRANIQ